MAVGRAAIARPGPSAALLVSRLRRRFSWYAATVGAGRVAIAALGVKLRVEGEHHIPLTGPVILAVNHVSYVDFVPVAAAAVKRKREARFFVRYDVWNPPGIAGPLTAMQHIPVDRQAPAAAYLQARRLLQQGELVSNFPEAGISYSFTVRSLMKGTAALALETDAVVVPAALWGTQRIYSVGRPRKGKTNRYDLTRGRTVDLLCGPPLPIAPGDDLAEWTERLGAAMTHLLEELQRRPEHRPHAGEYAWWYPAHLGGHAPDRAEAAAWDVVPRAAVRPTWGPVADHLDGPLP